MYRAINRIFSRMATQVLDAAYRAANRVITYSARVIRMAGQYVVTIVIDGRMYSEVLTQEEARQLLSYTTCRIAQVCGAYHRTSNVETTTTFVEWQGELSW